MLLPKVLISNLSSRSYCSLPQKPYARPNSETHYEQGERMPEEDADFKIGLNHMGSLYLSPSTTVLQIKEIPHRPPGRLWKESGFAHYSSDRPYDWRGWVRDRPYSCVRVPYYRCAS